MTSLKGCDYLVRDLNSPRWSMLVLVRQLPWLPLVCRSIGHAAGTRPRPPWKLALRREPGIEPVCDPACCWRINVRKHYHEVAGLRVDPQVPVHARRAPAVAHRAVPVAVPKNCEPVGVPGARASVRLPGDQQLCGVGTEQLVAQQCPAEPGQVPGS